MINKCLAENKGFGITSTLGTEIFRIGCYVKVEKVLMKYESGEMDIIVKGLSRFIHQNIKIHEDGYHIAEVFDYKDNNLPTDKELLSVTIKEFESLLEKLNIDLDEAFWKNFRYSRTKSYKIAEKSGLSMSEQQELLSLREENARLNFLKEHFTRLHSQFTENMTTKIIAMNDGYIN